MKKIIFGLLVIGSIWPGVSMAATFKVFRAKPPTHIRGAAMLSPQGLSPIDIKNAYHLPSTGGSGTIAIIGAYHDSKLESDLGTFSTQFNLPACTIKNKCLEIHKMKSSISSNTGWALEASMDVEWSHAIAPTAKILMVEAVSPNGTDLLNAIDYARNRADVVAVSMSWGGPESSDEQSLESHFVSTHGALFFASSGDNGTGVSWPAVSANVVAVGGTSLTTSASKVVEKAWSGSGGGVSAFISEPDYQKQYSIPKAGGMRAIPDVSYNADPASGFAVYDSLGFNKQKGWFVLGGTSAGAPQWAAIQALGHSSALSKLYLDKASTAAENFFRDITSGTNGDCTYYCTARRHFDYVTGLGSPLTVNF